MALEVQRRVTGSSAYSANRGSQIHNRTSRRGSWRMTSSKTASSCSRPMPDLPAPPRPTAVPALQAARRRCRPVECTPRVWCAELIYMHAHTRGPETLDSSLQSAFGVP